MSHSNPPGGPGPLPAPRPPRVLIEELADAVHGEIALFVGAREASTVGRTSRRLRSPYNRSVGGMTIKGDPRPKALAELLRLRPQLVALTVPQAAIPALALAITTDLLPSLRALTLVYPRADAPSAGTRDLLSIALGTGKLPALEAVSVQHAEGAAGGPRGLETEGLEMLMGLAATAADGGVPSPRWASLQVPYPLATQDAVLLARIVKARGEMRAAGTAVAPLQLPEGWWDVRAEQDLDPRVTASALALVEEAFEPNVIEIMRENAAGDIDGLTMFSAKIREEIITRSLLFGVIWKHTIERATALGSEQRPVAMTPDWIGLDAAFMMYRSLRIPLPAVTSVVMKDYVLILGLIANNLLPNLKSLAFHGTDALFTAEGLRLALKNPCLQNCTSLSFTNMQFDDDSCPKLLTAITRLPRLQWLHMDGCTLPEEAVVVFSRLLLALVGALPAAESDIYAFVADFRANDLVRAEADGAVVIEELALPNCQLTRAGVEALCLGLIRRGLPRLRVLDLRGNAGVDDEAALTLLLGTSSMREWSAFAPLPLTDVRREGTAATDRGVEMMADFMDAEEGHLFVPPSACSASPPASARACVSGWRRRRRAGRGWRSCTADEEGGREEGRLKGIWKEQANARAG